MVLYRIGSILRSSLVLKSNSFGVELKCIMFQHSCTRTGYSVQAIRSAVADHKLPCSSLRLLALPQNGKRQGFSDKKAHNSY